MKKMFLLTALSTVLLGNLGFAKDHRYHKNHKAEHQERMKDWEKRLESMPEDKRIQRRSEMRRRYMGKITGLNDHKKKFQKSCCKKKKSCDKKKKFCNKKKRACDKKK